MKRCRPFIGPRSVGPCSSCHECVPETLLLLLLCNNAHNFNMMKTSEHERWQTQMQWQPAHWNAGVECSFKNSASNIHTYTPPIISLGKKCEIWSHFRFCSRIWAILVSKWNSKNIVKFDDRAAFLPNLVQFELRTMPPWAGVGRLMTPNEGRSVKSSITLQRIAWLWWNLTRSWCNTESESSPVKSKVATGGQIGHIAITPPQIV